MFSSIITNPITVTQFCICLGAALFCGLLTARAYMIRNVYSKSFICSLVLIPAIIATIIIMVNGNLGTGVAIMGAFSLVRFRSTPGTSKEMATIFSVMASGLAAGMGQIGFALLFTILIAILSTILHLSNFGSMNERIKMLKITMPETIDDPKLFDSILKKYASRFAIEKIKTTNIGSLFEAEYFLELKGQTNPKEMIDELRVYNRNLPILLSIGTEREEFL